jgi:hypothetical protein
MHKSQKRKTRRVGRNESKQPLQTEEPGIGKDSYYGASAVSPNANHQDKTSSLFTIDRIAKQLTNTAQTLVDPHFKEPESQQPLLDCITQIWHQHTHLFARGLEDFSNVAHSSAVIVAIQYSATLLQNQDDEVPDYEPSVDDDEYSCLTLHIPPSSQKIFLERFLTDQLYTERL